jgi:hypothetical protein
MPRRIRGRVSRFGQKGFGFIESRELDRAAWFHVRLLRDIEAIPAVGDDVEFDVLVLPDGRVQAHDVAPVGSGPRPVFQQPEEPSEPRASLRARLQLPADLIEKLRRGIDETTARQHEAPRVAETAEVFTPVAQVPEEPPVETEVDVEPAEPPKRGSLGEGVQAILGGKKQRRAQVEAEASRLDDECRSTEGRIAAVRADAERRVLAIREEHAEKERRAERLRAEAAGMAVRPQERRAAWSEVLLERGARLAGSLVERADTLRGRSTARRTAVAALGAAVVERYEEVRRRAGNREDPIAAEAYSRMETELRREVAKYADAMDAAGSVERISIPVAVATGRSGTVTVLPIPTTELFSDPCWRVAAAFSHAMEIAAREMTDADCAPEYGQVGGCIAVRIAAGIDVELFELLLGEMWLARPTLTEIESVFEVEIAPSLEFEPHDGDERDELEGALEPRGQLPAVAARLDLSLSEVVGALVAHGLPFPDDEIDDGVEASLRSLLGLGANEEPPEDVPESSGPPLDRSSPPVVASRVLSRLLRDGRVGGRHTGIEHVYGHHFADEEKKVARKVVDRLLVMGILRKKLNEGAFHVYIDPRRLREVWAIINLEWRDEGVFG